MNVIKKSQGVSLLLTFLLGPLGLFYSSIGGGILLTLLAVVSASTIIIPILCWPIAMLAGALSVNTHNRNVDTTISLLSGKNNEKS